MVRIPGHVVIGLTGDILSAFVHIEIGSHQLETMID